jgi:adenylosuccinate lyase
MFIMDKYISPIGERYSAPNNSLIWNIMNRIKIMRNLWLSLAKSQFELGISCINEAQIKELEENISYIDLAKITHYENITKHDIMANILAYGDLCPNAKKIIHLGATSCFITDNADLIMIKQSLKIIKESLLIIIQNLLLFIEKYKLVPTLAYTHLQSAQLTTIGKRASLWLNDLFEDYKELNMFMDNLKFRGAKGTTGSEDSFLTLFNGDTNKCKLLNEKLANNYNFKYVEMVTSQTYSRKQDVKLFNILSNISQSFYKICNDMRLLASKGEISEYFLLTQVGSSAMAYKQNPITCEKICSLSRYIINQQNAMSNTYINQWCERTLDDSAIRRIIIPECFMLLENIENEFNNLIKNLVVHEDEIENKVKEHMPYVITEKILMISTLNGYDRQHTHDTLRKICMKIKNKNNLNIEELFENELIKENNNLIDLYRNLSKEPIEYIGNIPCQIDDFLNVVKQYLQ